MVLFNFFGVLFSLCSSSNVGGIYFDNLNSNISLYFYNFFQCIGSSKTSHGGGIYILNCFELIFLEIYVLMIVKRVEVLVMYYGAIK